MIDELKAGANYENFLQKAFRNSSLKEVIPKPQEEFIKVEDVNKLQENIARNNLNTMLKGQTALIAEIIQTVIDEDGDLSNFNKYFPTFKAAISGYRILSVKDFNALWLQFKAQKLGQLLQPILPQVEGTPMNLEYLQKLKDSELDKLFKKLALEKRDAWLATGNKVDDFKIQYTTSKGVKSRGYKVKDLESTTKTAQIVGLTTGDKNGTKIRYILETLNPDVDYGKMKVKWVGGKGLSDPNTVIKLNRTRVLPNELSTILTQKKKLVSTKLR